MGYEVYWSQGGDGVVARANTKIKSAVWRDEGYRNNVTAVNYSKVKCDCNDSDFLDADYYINLTFTLF